MSENWNSLRKAAEDLGSNLDTERAWARFEERREKDKKRIFPWWLFGLILIGSTSILWLNSEYGFMKDNMVSVDASTQTDDTQRQAATLTDDSATTKSKPNIEDDHTKPQSEINKPTPTKPTQTSTTTTNLTGTSRTPLAQSPAAQSVTSKETSLNKSENTSRGPTREKNKTTSRDNNNLASYKSTDMESNMASPAEVDPSPKDNLRGMAILESLDLQSVTHDYLRPEIHCGLETSDYTPLAPMKSKEKLPRCWDLELNYTYALADRQTDWIENAFNQRRSDEEEFKENNVLEILIARHLNPSFSILSGLTLNQYRTTTFEVEQTLENFEFDNVVVTTLTRNGETNSITGSAIGTRTHISERIRQQKYRSLSVPLYLRYKLEINKMTAGEVTTGLSYSLWHRPSGVLFSSATSRGSFAPVSELGYRELGLTEGILSVGLRRKLDGPSSLALAVRYSSDLNNRRSVSDENEKFSSLGLTLSLRRKL